MPKVFLQKVLVVVTSIGIGLLLILQIRSFAKVETLVNRDRNPNVFREIQILRGIIENLRKEIVTNEKQLSDITSRASSFTSLRDEMQKLELLTGAKAISGEGVKITVPANIDAVWFVDLVNELVTSGAEAISVNTVRLTGKDSGFRSVPGAILMGDRVFRFPYVIEVIGDKKLLSSALLQPGGLIERLEKALGKVKAVLIEEEKITIPARS